MLWLIYTIYLTNRILMSYLCSSSTVVDRVLPLSRLGEAHALLEARAVGGKIVCAQDLHEL